MQQTELLSSTSRLLAFNCTEVTFSVSSSTLKKLIEYSPRLRLENLFKSISSIPGQGAGPGRRHQGRLVPVRRLHRGGGRRREDPPHLHAEGGARPRRERGGAQGPQHPARPGPARRQSRINSKSQLSKLYSQKMISNTHILFRVLFRKPKVHGSFFPL